MEQQTQKFTCPMPPQITQDARGKCPICGMDLVPIEKQRTVEERNPSTHEHIHHEKEIPPMGHHGHDHHAMMIDAFKKRFYVGLVLTIPIMPLSEMIQHWLNIHIRFAAFENSRKVTTLVFDKTGTLTIAKFEVPKVVPVQKGLDEKELVRLATALEQNSEHPIATGDGKNDGI